MGPDEKFHWLLYTIIIAQFITIALLLGSLSRDYLSNQYMQAWVKQNAPALDLILNGNLDALFVGAAVGLSALLIRRGLTPAKTRAENLVKADPTVTTSSRSPKLGGIERDNMAPDTSLAPKSNRSHKSRQEDEPD